MINNDIFNRQVPGSELGQVQIKDNDHLKYEEFEHQTEYQAQQVLKNMIQKERAQEKAEERQGQTS